MSQVSIWIASFENPINTVRKQVVSNESEVSSLKSMFDKNNNQYWKASRGILDKINKGMKERNLAEI